MLKNARILYSLCPLCESNKLKDIGTVSCDKSPAYVEGLPKHINWRMCNFCGHVFTDGYFTGEALKLIFSKLHQTQTPGVEVESSRSIAGRMVNTVCTAIGRYEGRWLDVGFGNGSLMTTASEFGFDVVGLDLRKENVERLSEYSYDVHCKELCSYCEFGTFDVVSMADVLEHMPFPRQELQHIKKLLKPKGVLFVSSPNMDSFVWKNLDKNQQNPYWSEIEHYHNFGRQQLYGLLIGMDFEPVYYGVSERYRAGMEVIFLKKS